MRKDRVKIAVVGAGAAGLGALTALLDKKNNFNIFVYDIGKTIESAPAADNPTQDWIASFYNQIYQKIRSRYSFKFPPAKTHFGEQIARQPVGKKFKIFKSETFGGLTNYWGATMLPFTDKELKNWPIKKEELWPYYEKISRLVGLSACSDELNQYFKKDFSTRPPLRPTAALNRLGQSINQNPSKGKFKIISGINRCGVETRENHPNSCVYCGECLAGCFRDSIYSARKTIREYLKDPRVKYRAGAKVSRLKEKNGLVEIELEDGQLEKGFSKVFLAAGCPSSTEIILRSIGFKDKLTMADNAVYVFPIFYFGRKPKEENKSYFALCNLVLGCLPKNEKAHFAQVQVYPNFDYLWRYNLPAWLWKLVRPVFGFLRSHIFWGRLYLHSDYSQSYSVQLKDNQLVMKHLSQAKPGKYLKDLISSLRSGINHNGFYFPPIPPLRQRVNSHYTSTIPYNGEKIKVSSLGEVMPKVYLCDSSVFPEMPAINPGFTIMANACRIAAKAI
ncbi:MAG: hypothetical protein CO003_01610 [Candidatus Portnoybacteria bacterium CG_4_8_14_3_um_filter_44_15]|uniref:Glucose-methanol-choline oxidoreductase C-terminal domain-containing protein n=4 Tax=Candidatus Portnoyibacteriota TaxID=1817913 RepID=A0A2M7YL65_9BACT|nr:MAG: hypothetical protein COX45_02245 [Candidatus Portnoybacteria bacterium CG23_combo_of_CG06-09_8_20_14_all_44_36]PIW74644.1 MAG: hypothetical protein CO003_01610 [Candidatus Portnoybacteria bacterium CG_4_8_14_3_um_filter_44_15]PIZ69112.1 MAG: hypothetical protein COY10_02075 [Candidatus Portnoybacteria bacterium CG_4_10_14_0_2_um_filter_43_36]PJA63720.1 MAG: hypothetical protein CO160_02200 [Candidatus Portnoybacteria bacterium CG_4_9_14_3_um_filter_43_11]PJE59113.1 MAG: hypothetical pro